MALLTVRNLGVTFLSGKDRVRAVDDVSFQLEPGERLGVVGESGSGKSALHLALLRLLPRPPICETAGQALLNETEILSLPEKKLQPIRGGQIAMVFQNPLSALNPFLTVGEQIAEPLVYHQRLSTRDARKAAITLLERIGIDKAAQRFRDYPHQFSGGMRQRVMVAMALAARPKIIIADEPTTALDASVRQQILKLFQEVCHEHNTALILITHDLAAAAQVCGRIHVMYAGRIVEAGPTEKVTAEPRHPYTAALLQASLRESITPGEMLRAIPGRPADARRPVAGCAFHPRCEFRESRCEKDVPQLQNDQSTSKRSGQKHDSLERQFACHVDWRARGAKSYSSS
ncbi:MAG: ABC transporter ATP-binding protein [Pirellulales bacterium]|nr:ABC transporter ATP-binding protein [Pirellulales bacterium]